ncbi:hypothetical protein AaE_008085 [Aphanomyces astaci]|uniref:Uncharacterized protein n=1 Tax=Aphanomyces astaci TaxID=112090 RepID=A0A6A5A8C5_APHAT|nr:hypothetical protein AaE_008085 [Aphanomyces astaci]
MKHDSGNVNLFEMGCALTSALCLERSGVAHEANQIEMVQSGVLDMLCVAMQTNNQLASVYIGAAQTIDAIHGLLVALLFAAGTADRALKSDLPQLFSMGLHSFFKDAAVVTALAQVLFQLHVASPQPAKDVFCAKEMPFHLVTIFEDVITAVSQRRSGGGGASSAAFLSFVSAVIFSHVAIMTNVSTSSTCGIVTHPARVQMLMKASVHTFAVSSLTQFPKVIPVLEQCVRVLELLAMPGNPTHPPPARMSLSDVRRHVQAYFDSSWGVETDQVHCVDEIASWAANAVRTYGGRVTVAS